MVWVNVFEQCMPYAGALMMGLWLQRYLRQAQHQISAMVERIKQLEAKLSTDDTTDEDFVEIGFDPDNTEPLPLPRSLPLATARYRT
jgi:hypothetical protein